MNFKKYVVGLLLMFFILSGCSCEDEVTDKKPVIYLYPEEVTEVSVQLNYEGQITCSYPTYNNGWNVIAYPDGTLINNGDHKEYTSLFWEGKSNIHYDTSEGFVIAGKDTACFLDEKLEYLGLNPKERNEFIMYWLPQMQKHPYNLIAFQEDVYTNHAQLNIHPRPDTFIRVFMAYKPFDKKVNIPQQNLKPMTRKGFTVVEWGGAQVQ